MQIATLKVPVVASLRRFGAILSLVFIVTLQSPAQAAREAVASGHALATAAGMQVLAQGGNAFDAAVAVAAALGVVEPYTSGLGGGGFFLLHRASDGFEVMIDARETAPSKARPDLYIGSDGKPDEKSSIEGARAAAIPGVPAGLAWLAQNYGRLSLAASLAPAVRLAREGFPTDQRYQFVVGWRESMLKANPQLASVFLDRGAAPAPGFIVHQPELARTLEALAAHGRDGFYKGDVAQRMVAGVQAGGGIWELDDLQRYKVVERSPQHFTYRGARITCASLPSSGGLTLAQSLQILEHFPLESLDPVERIHVVAEAWRRGYQDRALYLGDPDFVTPPAWLGTRAYADRRAASIDLAKATPSQKLAWLREGDDTTHFSIADAEGNRVAATLTINLPFGSGVVAGDTGVWDPLESTCRHASLSIL